MGGGKIRKERKKREDSFVELTEERELHKELMKNNNYENRVHKINMLYRQNHLIPFPLLFVFREVAFKH